ncbi:DEAD/DEAH box helicase [Pseudomonas sp. BAY1663]|nr:DEAD/DEAH box helicase [Pseudomonas sp. BAY1663]
MSFASLGLSEALAGAVEAAGYTQPTPVQQRAIPAVLQGRDLMVAPRPEPARQAASPCRYSNCCSPAATRTASTATARNSRAYWC